MIITEALIGILVVSLTQVFKPLIKDARWHAPLSVGFGVLIGLLAWLVSGDPLMIVSGLVGALIASGVYDNAKVAWDLTKSLQNQKDQK